MKTKSSKLLQMVKHMLLMTKLKWKKRKLKTQKLKKRKLKKQKLKKLKLKVVSISRKLTVTLTLFANVTSTTISHHSLFWKRKKCFKKMKKRRFFVVYSKVPPPPRMGILIQNFPTLAPILGGTFLYTSFTVFVNFSSTPWNT